MDLFNGLTARLPAEHMPVMQRVKKKNRAVSRQSLARFEYRKKPPVKPPRPRPLTKFEKDQQKRQAKDAWMIAPATEDETWFRHHNWAARRAEVRKALILSHANEFQMNRFDECGSECLVEWSESEQRHRLRANHCKCRHCAPCNKAKGSLLSKNLHNRLEAGPADGQRFRFITLTLRHSPKDTFGTLLAKLYKCFAQLRKSELWKESQDGGCAILETKWSKAGGFHPHLHVISEGHWLKAEKLQREWHRITGDSFKADIRALNDIKDTCFYVSKYVGKGVNDELWHDTGAAAEYILSMKGVRFCMTYGKWRGFGLLKPDKAHEAKDWKPVCLLSQLAARARSGELDAILLCEQLEAALCYNPHKKRNTTKSNDSG